MIHIDLQKSTKKIFDATINTLKYLGDRLVIG